MVILPCSASGAWYAYAYRGRVTELVDCLAAHRAEAGSLTPDRKSLEAPPLAGFSGTPETIDATLQATALWRVIKREFPDWYARAPRRRRWRSPRRTRTTRPIGQQMARALVELRRQQVEQRAVGQPAAAEGASPATFYDNLTQLRKHSDEACYEFISQGEASPTVVSLLQGSPHTAHLQAQLTAVFEAIADGRKTPRVYPHAAQDRLRHAGGRPHQARLDASRHAAVLR